MSTAGTAPPRHEQRDLAAYCAGGKRAERLAGC